MLTAAAGACCLLFCSLLSPSFPFLSFPSLSLSLSLLLSQLGTARQVDRASLYLDAVNMAVFIIDAILFFQSVFF